MCRIVGLFTEMNILVFYLIDMLYFRLAIFSIDHENQKTNLYSNKVHLVYNVYILIVKSFISTKI